MKILFIRSIFMSFIINNSFILIHSLALFMILFISIIGDLGTVPAVAAVLLRQWAEAEYENDQELLSASRDVFDHIIRPVSKWAYEEGVDRPLLLRRLFCKELIKILKEHTWIAKEAKEETRNDFRNMLAGLGNGVGGVQEAIASLSRDSAQVAKELG